MLARSHATSRPFSSLEIEGPLTARIPEAKRPPRFEGANLKRRGAPRPPRLSPGAWRLDILKARSASEGLDDIRRLRSGLPSARLTVANSRFVRFESFAG